METDEAQKRVSETTVDNSGKRPKTDSGLSDGILDFDFGYEAIDPQTGNTMTMPSSG